MDNNKKRVANPQTKEAMLASLERNLGNVYAAAKAANIPRSLHYQWLERDPDYRASVSDIKEALIDMVESEHLKRIKAGDTTAIIFFLKTQGKNRGYSERTELTGANGDPLIPAKPRTVQITVVRQKDGENGG